jgi:hypothetical protein
MSYFAEIDETNTVLRVLIVPDAQEERGQGYLAADLSLGGTWIQTGEFGAHVGGTYDAAAGVFILKQPYPSWSLDADHQWQPPTPQPGPNYYWDEDTTSWIEVEAS